MRVIAGIYRSRPLAAPRGSATRPTSDRLRETLFNVLAARIEGASFADLYAGSGAVGIEALSRGAKRVCFIEKSPVAAAAIRANLASLGIHSGYSIHACSVSSALKQFGRDGMEDPWDIVFLDPPYQHDQAYRLTLDALGGYASALLAPQAIVVAEHASQTRTKEPSARNYGRLQFYRLLEQGDAALSFYRFTDSEVVVEKQY